MEYGIKYMLYPDDTQITTVLMGNDKVGAVNITSHDKNYTDIAFYETKNKKASRLLKSEETIQEHTAIDPDIQFLFDNTESIDAVINKLNQAKSELLRLNQPPSD
ncbi:MAG: hypothetical protein PF440_11200 [Thiomicrorhabdus sp.]|nr:hypothetical protein [Thiomicrorhabdus sp.]